MRSKQPRYAKQYPMPMGAMRHDTDKHVYTVAQQSSVPCFRSRRTRAAFMAAPFLHGQVVLLHGFKQDPVVEHEPGEIVVPEPELPRILLSDPPTLAESALAAHYQEVQQIVVQVRMGLDECLEKIDASKEPLSVDNSIVEEIKGIAV